LEAKKRRVTSQQLYDLEVTKKISEPTPAEIKKFMDENRDQFEGGDAATVSPQVAAFLHGQRESRLSEEFVRRLRTSTPVVMGVDLGTPNLAPDVVVATVGGRPILAGLLNERLKPIIYSLRIDVYETERKRAEQMVDDLLLVDEAKRRNIAPEDIIRSEISEKVHPPTEAEVSKFYTENKKRINGELDTVRNQLVNYLQDQEQQRLEKGLSDRLRKGADIRWLIAEPPQPVQAVSTDDDPSRGDVNAPVTMVEFTDFQCPACSAMQPVLEEVLKSYGNKVRFVVRDFPLNQHANARKAAEAADAANAQGKFFEYTALLFQRQNALDVPSLKKYATELGLNRARFDAELDGGAYAAEVKHDVDDGEIYGIESTPTIFINGVMLRTLSADSLREAIDRAAKPQAPK
jgi:protein-disulfide isomerase